MPVSLFEELSRSSRRRRLQRQDTFDDAMRDLKWRTTQGRYDRAEARTIIDDAKVGIKDHLTSVALRLADPTIERTELDALKAEIELKLPEAGALWNPDNDPKVGNYMDIIKADIEERYQAAEVSLGKRTMLSQSFAKISDLGDKKRSEGIFIEDGSLPVLKEVEGFITKSLDEGSTTEQLNQAFALADLAKQRQFVHSMINYYDSDEAKEERKEWGSSANLKFEQAKRSIILSENYDESENLIKTLHSSAAQDIQAAAGPQAKMTEAMRKRADEAAKMYTKSINSWFNSGTKNSSFDKEFLSAFNFNADDYPIGSLTSDKKGNAGIAYKEYGYKFMRLLKHGGLSGVDDELEDYIEKDDLQGVLEYFANDSPSFPGSDKSLGQSRLEELSSGDDDETNAALSVLQSFLGHLLITDAILRQQNKEIPTKLGTLQEGWGDFDKRFNPNADAEKAWENSKDPKKS